MTGYGDTLRTQNPETYARLKSAFDWVPSLAARLRGEPLVLEVGPLHPSRATVVRLASPGSGTVDLSAVFVPNPELRTGSRIVLAVRGTDGVTRRYPRKPGEMTVRAGLDLAGVQDVWIRWRVVRYSGPRPVPDPGIATNVRAVRWTG